jgi:hypothetical protein
MPGDPKTRDGNIPAVAIANDEHARRQRAWQSHSGDTNVNPVITATRECRSVGGEEPVRLNPSDLAADGFA